MIIHPRHQHPLNQIAQNRVSKNHPHQHQFEIKLELNNLSNPYHSQLPNLIIIIKKCEK